MFDLHTLVIMNRLPTATDPFFSAQEHILIKMAIRSSYQSSPEPQLFVITITLQSTSTFPYLASNAVNPCLIPLSSQQTRESLDFDLSIVIIITMKVSLTDVNRSG